MQSRIARRYSHQAWCIYLPSSASRCPRRCRWLPHQEELSRTTKTHWQGRSQTNWTVMTVHAPPPATTPPLSASALGHQGQKAEVASNCLGSSARQLPTRSLINLWLDYYGTTLYLVVYISSVQPFLSEWYEGQHDFNKTWGSFLVKLRGRVRTTALFTVGSEFLHVSLTACDSLYGALPS